MFKNDPSDIFSKASFSLLSPSQSMTETFPFIPTSSPPANPLDLWNRKIIWPLFTTCTSTAVGQASWFAWVTAVASWLASLFCPCPPKSILSTSARDHGISQTAHLSWSKSHKMATESCVIWLQLHFWPHILLLSVFFNLEESQGLPPPGTNQIHHGLKAFAFASPSEMFFQQITTFAPSVSFSSLHKGPLYSGAFPGHSV